MLLCTFSQCNSVRNYIEYMLLWISLQMQCQGLQYHWCEIESIYTSLVVTQWHSLLVSFSVEYTIWYTELYIWYQSKSQRYIRNTIGRVHKISISNVVSIAANSYPCVLLYRVIKNTPHVLFVPFVYHQWYAPVTPTTWKAYVKL